MKLQKIYLDLEPICKGVLFIYSFMTKLHAFQCNWVDRAKFELASKSRDAFAAVIIYLVPIIEGGERVAEY